MYLGPRDHTSILPRSGVKKDFTATEKHFRRLDSRKRAFGNSSADFKTDRPPESDSPRRARRDAGHRPRHQLGQQAQYRSLRPLGACAGDRRPRVAPTQSRIACARSARHVAPTDPGQDTWHFPAHRGTRARAGRRDDRGEPRDRPPAHRRC